MSFKPIPPDEVALYYCGDIRYPQFGHFKWMPLGPTTVIGELPPSHLGEDASGPVDVWELIACYGTTIPPVAPQGGSQGPVEVITAVEGGIPTDDGNLGLLLHVDHIRRVMGITPQAFTQLIEGYARWRYPGGG